MITQPPSPPSPPKPRAPLRPLITIRVSRAEREALNAIAKGYGLSLNQYVRLSLDLPMNTPPAEQPFSGALYGRLPEPA